VTRYLQDWEGITPSGTVPTAGNSGTAPATAFDAAIIVIGGTSTLTSSNAQAANGTLGGLVTASASETAYCGWSSAIGTLTEFWGRMSIYFTANPAGSTRIFSGFNASTRVGAVQVGTTGRISLIDSGNSNQGTMTNAIALNQWNRVEWHMLCSATVGMLEVKLFQTVTSGSPTETLTTAATLNTSTQTTAYRFGRSESATGATGTFYIDDLAIDTAGYPGPYAIVGSGATIIGATIRKANRHVALREFNR
jgi:hypothetical protein